METQDLGHTCRDKKKKKKLYYANKNESNVKYSITKTHMYVFKMHLMHIQDGITSKTCLRCLSDGGGTSARADLDVPAVRSANQSPQSVGSSGADSGVDSLCDPAADLPHVAISLCGGLTDNKEITRGRRRPTVPRLAAACAPRHRGVRLSLPTEQFQERAISYRQFSDNPSVIDDPNLVVKIGNKCVAVQRAATAPLSLLTLPSACASRYYNWSTAAPVMLAMQVYQKPLPQVKQQNAPPCVSCVSSAVQRLQHTIKDCVKTQRIWMYCLPPPIQCATKESTLLAFQLADSSTGFQPIGEEWLVSVLGASDSHSPAAEGFTATLAGLAGMLLALRPLPQPQLSKVCSFARVKSSVTSVSLTH